LVSDLSTVCDEHRNHHQFEVIVATVRPNAGPLVRVFNAHRW
jgi:hypothetical protein